MPFEQITVNDLKTLIENNRVTIIDIRDSASFESGHIEKAHNIGDHNINKFIEEADPEKPLVVCCYHGISSQSAAEYMSEKGFKQCYSLQGGYEAWTKNLV